MDDDATRIYLRFPSALGVVFFRVDQEIGIRQVGGPRNHPVPLLRPFELNDFFDNGATVTETSSFGGHMVRFPPSRRPGIDGDVNFPTENLSLRDRPVVHSPASGRITIEENSKTNAMYIEDKNGYKHYVLHTHHSETAFDGSVENVFGWETGMYVEIGQPVGYLGNAGTNRDHLHYHLLSSNNEIIDPNAAFFDSLDGTFERLDSDFPGGVLNSLGLEHWMDLRDQIPEAIENYDDRDGRFFLELY